MPVSIYKSSTDYLRIGPKDLITKEVAYQKSLLAFGFPVPPITKEGEYQGEHYFIEPSLGDRHFSQIFRANLSDTHIVSDTDFNTFLAFVKTYTAAQLKTAGDRVFIAKEFESMIQYEVIIKELPFLAEMTTAAMQKAEKHISTLPIVLTHGDFNPHNIFETGVIDWERASFAPLGYDLVTNISQIFFFPSRGDFEFVGSYTYSKEQIARYWRELDALCVAHGFPKLSDYANDFIFCRSIWSVVRMDRWPKIQEWRYAQYEKLLTEYLTNGDVTRFLFEYRS